MTGVFDRPSQGPLMTSASTGPAVTDNPTIRIEKLFKHLSIFIINRNIIIGTKMTVFGHSKGIVIRELGISNKK